MTKTLATLAILAAASCLGANAFAQEQEVVYQPDIIELDGSNGLSLIPDPEFVLAEGGTIEFWVEPDWTEDPGYDPVIISSAGEEGASYMIALLRDRDGLGILAGEEEGFVAFDFSDGKLHHVAVNSYAEDIVVFIDGEPQGALDFGFADLPASGVWVGSADGAMAPFVGAIGAMRVWGVPVEQEAIADYRFLDVFSEANEPHPDIDYLQAISDFENADVLTIEGDFAEDDATEEGE